MTSLDHRIADGSSRAGVLKVLRDRGDLVKVEELAEAVSLSLSAVRFHLERLVADGLVRTAKEPRTTPGRPRVMYQAVPEAAVDDGAAYRHLASLLAAELAALGGLEAAEAAGRAWAGQVVVPVAGGPAGQSVRSTASRPPDRAPESLAGVLAVLEDGGFAPLVRDDGWTIELHRCPFTQLMPSQSQIVCSVHRGLVTAIPEISGSLDPAVLFPMPGDDVPCIVRFRQSEVPTGG